MWRFPALVLAASALLAAWTVPPGPFAWSGLTWCPTYQGWSCTAVQHPGQYTVSFSPARVSVSRGGLDLSLSGGVSGAVNTASYETPGPGSVVSAVITLPCTAAGLIENWPAFWLASPGGEIDVMEGLAGHAQWHYHYPGGVLGGAVLGNWCGQHRYTVTWNRAGIRIWYDRTLASDLRVPVTADPMCILIDYGQGEWGGPDVSPAVMRISSVRE